MKPTTMLALLVTASVAAIGFVYLGSQSQGGFTLASGTITLVSGQGGTPVAGAVVSLGSYSAVSNASGVATLSNIPQPGNYALSVTATGFLPFNANLTLSGQSATFSIPITLTPG